MRFAWHFNSLWGVSPHIKSNCDLQRRFDSLWGVSPQIKSNCDLQRRFDSLWGFSPHIKSNCDLRLTKCAYFGLPAWTHPPFVIRHASALISRVKLPLRTLQSGWRRYLILLIVWFTLIRPETSQPSSPTWVRTNFRTKSITWFELEYVFSPASALRSSPVAVDVDPWPAGDHVRSDAFQPLLMAVLRPSMAGSRPSANSSDRRRSTSLGGQWWLGVRKLRCVVLTTTNANCEA
jgi:hypothetical protein